MASPDSWEVDFHGFQSLRSPSRLSGVLPLPWHGERGISRKFEIARPGNCVQGRGYRMIARDIIFHLSVRNVRLNLLRSLLAALGIVIGVIAIASIGMMGTNMTLSVTARSQIRQTNSLSPGYLGEETYRWDVRGRDGPPSPRHRSPSR